MRDREAAGARDPRGPDDALRRRRTPARADGSRARQPRSGVRRQRRRRRRVRLQLRERKVCLGVLSAIAVIAGPAPANAQAVTFDTTHSFFTEAPTGSHMTVYT